MTLPDFFVVGAMKSATTSLHHYVGQHPEVHQPPKKEPMYFLSPGRPPGYAGADDVRNLDLRGCWDLADYERLYERPAGIRSGDFSTMYMPVPEVPARVAAAVPDARIAVLLRDPVERAWSAWRMWRGLTSETLPFAEALAAEPERRAAGWSPACWYRELGFYGKHTARWIDQFGDDRVLVLLTDDLRRDPVATVQRLYRHIGVDPTFVPDTSEQLNVRDRTLRRVEVERWMRSSRSRSKRLILRTVPARIRQPIGHAVRKQNSTSERIDPGVAAELRRGYADDLELLMDRTGVDVRHWLPTARSGVG